MQNTFLRYIHLICLCIVMQMANAHDFGVGGLYYTFINSNQVEVSGYIVSPPTGFFVIPETVTYDGKTYYVTSIGNFSGCSDLISITIPNSVTSIGGGAFSGCSGLTSVTIPNSVTSIGGSTFSGCNGLRSVTIGNSVTSIGDGAFYDCSRLTSVTIPNSVTAIGYGAFQGCSGLTSITIGNSVTDIGDRAFLCCSSLTSIVVESGNTHYDSRNNCNAIIETASNTLLFGCNNTIIPKSVTAIGQEAFYGYNGLTSVTIPNSVTDIGQEAFYGCNGLTSVAIPNSVTDIGQEAFYGCNGLTSVTIPNSVTDIGQEAFYGCNGLTSVTIPNSVKAIKYGTFRNCSSLTSVTIPNSVTAIGSFAFYGCRSLTSVTIPNSVTAIGGSTFYNCGGLTSVTIPNSVTDIGVNAFWNCGLKTVYTKITNPFSVISCFSNTLNATLIVPRGTKSKYENLSGWNAFKEIKEEDVNNYSISITVDGNGSASYNNSTIRGKTSSFTIEEGNSATISFTPDEGYRIKEVKIDGDDISSSITDNTCAINNIGKDTSVEVVFEEIPQVEPEPATYTLKIKATGNGSASFDDTTVKAETATFTVNEGSTAILSFSPDNGNSVSVVMLNGKDITDKATNNRYVIDEIAQDITFEVVFKEDINALTVDGINYKVVSQSEKTVMVVGGDYGQVLTIPATVSQDGTTWKVTGIEKDALKDIAALCAVIWEPEAPFTADVSNPNLLLYVKDSQYAPADINNVVVNGSAASITLVDANSGNSFFCPQAFTAQKISYTHHYGMITGIGESRGWETIALPFDVQTVTHAVKGACRSFANWKSGDDARPFWLYELTGSGFAEATGIEAYTPYVISMPNHPRYEEKWILRGNVTFAATNTVVKKTEDVKTVTYGDRTFVPCFADMAADAGFYALNVNNDLSTNTNGMTEGSRFVLNMRKIHPFEAYMISTSNASRWYFDIFEDMTTAIKDIEKELLKDEQIYDLQGRKTQKPHKKGTYVTDGKKLIVR